ncbi:helix-turn-helix transcriptional regulator [Marilutibacter alkalisoli]|uniref:Helix-turn-helix transcriptional regulator n=1 Tax=Marilutibacter alkalisoli TaxID=2591633 RepID=A0A514BP98_9GAMM|nr:helix-turn-helix transcriptional regulator [Lysobacter alkalisoli]QDH69210.1 helix-turn-helix transcriptional regulator [Lysobacter alkalisoli]
MSASTREPGALLSRLSALAQHEGDTPYLRVRARAAHALSAVQIDSAIITVLLEGIKRVRDRGGEWRSVEPGQLLLVPGARMLDVENVPDETRGRPYLSVCITLGQELLDAARLLLPDTRHAIADGVAVEPLGDFAADLEAWCDAIATGNDTQARYALVGAVLGLCSRGHVGVLKPPAPTLAQRIRGLVAGDPARDWRSDLLESALDMSGATLRRRLAAEGTSLRNVVADARLAHALMLLQGTSLPVKTVAHRVGYASVSSFVKRFGERYGIEPSRVSAA